MAYKMFSVGLVLAFAGMCLCQQQSTSSSQSQYPQSTAVSQSSFQTGSAAALQQPQTKLEDIERDTLAAAFGQKTQQPSSNKPSSVAPSVPQQLQSQQPPQSYQAIPQQQYFVQPYQALPQQFYMQPYQTQQQYLAQPYQMAIDYAGVQYSVVAPNSYPGNQIYQQYYVPAVPQPSAVPEYVTKQSFPATAAAAPAQVQQEYKQQQFSAPAQAQQVYKQQQFVAAPAQAQQEYKQQQFATAPAQAQQEYKQQQFAAAPAQAQQEYKQQQFNALAQAQQQYKQVQQQYVVPSPAYQYVQQPAAPSSNGPADYSYSTRHPATTAVQFKAPTAAVQPQYQYNVLPQQYQQQPQYYYTVSATEQPRVQQSAKSIFSSGVKSTTPTPLVKEQFAYKFESSPQQQPGAAYSTLRYSA
ncbi:mediator of RNA polymerase II transcription subunit 15-like [Rhopalosiphum maidis]|uniref:mediator of RNA polymerase II transcription subunit 15-like n=1 Tax=Rhopalosiphum maidis TaxID=43146 RepID=UPI000EFE45C3|nr:mediator of RNA polymerase II transcription subunit 15-like [Rhopalosiphum maidis]